MEEDDKEFLKILHALDDSNGEDCPEELIKLAKTSFERAVCVEFFKLYKEFQSFKTETKTNMNWLKWLITGVFSVTVVTLLFQLVKSLVFHM